MCVDWLPVEPPGRDEKGRFKRLREKGPGGKDKKQVEDEEVDDGDEPGEPLGSRGPSVAAETLSRPPSSPEPVDAPTKEPFPVAKRKKEEKKEKKRRRQASDRQPIKAKPDGDGGDGDWDDDLFEDKGSPGGPMLNIVATG